MTQYECLMDNFNELKDWQGCGSCEPIVVQIRANCVENISFIDMYVRDNDQGISRNDIPNYDNGMVFVAYKYGYHLKLDPYLRWNRSVTDITPLVQSNIVELLVRNQIIPPRDAIRSRLTQLNEAIPETDDQKMKLLLRLFGSYKENMAKAVFDQVFGDFAQMTVSGSHGGLARRSQDFIQEEFAKITSTSFSRFPLILMEVEGIANSVSTTVFHPQLEEITRYILQNHFLLIHSFECDHGGKCTGECAYRVLVNAFLSALIDQYRSALATSVEDELPSWIPLLQEPCSIIEERNKLKQLLKVMHKYFTLLDY